MIQFVALNNLIPRKLEACEEKVKSLFDLMPNMFLMFFLAFFRLPARSLTIHCCRTDTAALQFLFHLFAQASLYYPYTLLYTFNN